MAASLLVRGCVPSQTRRLCISLCSSHIRLFSSKKEETESASSVDQKSDAPSLEQPVVDNKDTPTNLRTSRISPTEGAVDKFFKVVERVKKSHEEKGGSDSKTSQATVQEDSNESFATMFRKSKFVSLGEFKGRLVQGTIVEVMEDDLYIDFGGKFHCVCPRPKRNPDLYHRGTKVMVNLQAMEMSSAFLGSDIHVTLLEADGTLLGLAPSGQALPVNEKYSEKCGCKLISEMQSS